MDHNDGGAGPRRSEHDGPSVRNPLRARILFRETYIIFCTGHEKVTGKIIAHKICCPCNEKWQANITKICACHQKQLRNHKIPPLRRKVTSQEILPLPRRCATVPSVPLFLYGPFLYSTALFYFSYSIYLTCSITAWRGSFMPMSLLDCSFTAPFLTVPLLFLYCSFTVPFLNWPFLCVSCFFLAFPLLLLSFLDCSRLFFFCAARDLIVPSFFFRGPHVGSFSSGHDLFLLNIAESIFM